MSRGQGGLDPFHQATQMPFLFMRGMVDELVSECDFSVGDGVVEHRFQLNVSWPWRARLCQRPGKSRRFRSDCRTTVEMLRTPAASRWLTDARTLCIRTATSGSVPGGGHERVTHQGIFGKGDSGAIDHFVSAGIEDLYPPWQRLAPCSAVFVNSVMEVAARTGAHEALPVVREFLSRSGCRDDPRDTSTIAAILQNPRYTGYAFFGRWTKTESLLDPDDVAAGHIVMFKRSPAQRIIRSRHPARPAIISVETFTQATLKRKQRAGISRHARSKLERTRSSASTTPRPFRGRVRCDLCNREMQAENARGSVYYRCRASAPAPGSPQLAHHPRTINLREDHIIEPVDTWLATLFAPANIDRTVSALLTADNATPPGSDVGFPSPAGRTSVSSPAPRPMTRVGPDRPGRRHRRGSRRW
ncbi:recombinase family protein [Nocardia sp. NPDC050378]|uniref:recombinase family protein n=1 Tax=Nocardia sp. NPDC050378 TaxID=3155400 RepID=UPI0033E77DCC